MFQVACSALLLVAISSASGAAAEAPQARARLQPARSNRVEVRLFELSAVRRLFHTLARRGDAMNEGERAAAVADFSVMSEAVIGGSPGGPFSFDELVRAASSGGGPQVSAARGVGSRDEAAYQLLALGYSARETADVVSGRISQQALDTAQRMIAVGKGRDAAADYLDAQYRLETAARNARNAPRFPSYRDNRTASSHAFDGFIEYYAQMHQVAAPLVRAIMHTESAFNPAARSHAGAIGLMQLMPSTARELGVNPFVPEQNIEGGVRYFSQLLRMFGGIELALIAYNAGPGFAQRYARGQTALYGETRDYVRRVLARVGQYQ
jgi:soluble lytic murein transglycosylase-like protein